jgi:hypothetical protein
MDIAFANNLPFLLFPGFCTYVRHVGFFDDLSLFGLSQNKWRLSSIENDYDIASWLARDYKPVCARKILSAGLHFE